MSLRNRARSLQKKTGLSYQQALSKLRGLGERPAALSRQTGWPLEVCDRFCVDGHAPIDVIEVVRAPAREELIRKVCETLRATTNARAVALLTMRGRILAHAGAHDFGVMMPGVLPRTAFALPEVWELDGGIVLYTARLKGALLVVKFQRDESSLGLVRLRSARAVDELERLLAGEPNASGMPPTSSGGGRGGIPAEVRVVEETRDAPPEPRPRPIGRKKKR